jgi:hypothetical protein
MRTFLARLQRLLTHLFHRSAPRRPGELSAIKYEAVSLIAYEDRAAYQRTREQADYCREMGSLRGAIFWNLVAAELLDEPDCFGRGSTSSGARPS